MMRWRYWPLLLLGLCGAGNASDGPRTLYRGATGAYELTVVSAPAGPGAGPRQLSVLVMPGAPQDRSNRDRSDLRLALQLEHPGETVAVTLEPTGSPLLYTAEVDLRRAGTWRATLDVRGAAGGETGETVSFAIEVFGARLLGAVVAGAAAAILGCLVLLAYGPGAPHPSVWRTGR